VGLLVDEKISVATFQSEIDSTCGRTEHFKLLYAIASAEFSNGGLMLVNKESIFNTSLGLCEAEIGNLCLIYGW
jgi:hypothetical protein